MKKTNYIQIRVTDEQKTYIQTNALKNNQTITDYIMSAIIEFEKINLSGCPYQFACQRYITYYASSQVIRLAIEVLDKEIDNRKRK